MVLEIETGRNIIESNYNYGGHFFECVTEQWDLGLIIDNRLKFDTLIAVVTVKATAALVFIKRVYYDISDVQGIWARSDK